MARNFPTTPQELDSYIMGLISGSIAGQVRQALQEMGASMESNGMDGEVPLVGDGVLSADTTTIPLAEVDGSGQPVRYVQARLSTLARLLDNSGGETPVTENVVAITASPSQATAGTACEISLVVTSAQQATSIRILRNGTQIATGSGTVLRHTDNFTPSSAGTTTYQAVVTANGTTKTATASINVQQAPPVQRLSVLVGHGANYGSAVFTDTNRQLAAGMHLTQEVNKNDYLFIKVDKTQGILLATTDNDDPTFNSEIQFDAPFTDGDYKVYKKTDAYPRAITARILIVTIN